MKTIVSRVAVLCACVLLSVIQTAAPARGQGSGSSRTNQPTGVHPAPATVRPAPKASRPMTTEEYAATLWRYLVREQSPYTRWPALPGKDGWRDAKAPHGPRVRLYANTVAAGDPKNLPYSSILVLEDYESGDKKRTGINVLYRVQGYDPANGDWYWMKFREDGTLAKTPPEEGSRPIAGRVTSCIDCHRKAAGKDFVYSNDPSPPAAAPAPAAEKKKGQDKADAK